MAHDPWTDRPEPRRLFRSTRDRMWAGVAGGMGEFFDVDPTLVRLIWVIATIITAGLVVAVYFVMWLIMPTDRELAHDAWGDPGPPPEAEHVSMGSAAADAGPLPPPEWDWSRRRDRWRGSYYPGRKRRSAGFVLIALGLLFLGAQTHLFNLIPWNLAWPLVLVVLGCAMLLRHRDWRL